MKKDNLYIDRKVIVWVRYFLQKDVDVDTITKLLKSNNLSYEKYSDEHEILLETAEDISVKDNGDSSTLELWDGNNFNDNECLWTNSPNV